ncbi:DUF7546 family protein [Halorarius halobius]|uniref:DUF7546 family protein n=1 Tax=Halorarius halobius TaxID=2962671 RepID=UPI0020CCBD42|nr:hypothetical protein [Halorarius halobius]
MTAGRLADRVRPVAVLAVVAVVAVELFALWLYLRAGDVAVTEPRYLLYPLVWVNAGVAAVALTRPSSRSPRVRLLAASVAGLYLVGLLVLDGSVGLAGGEGGPLRVVPLPPGWGPALVGSTAGVTVTLFPFKLVGYAALSYLLYGLVLDAARAALGGALGVVSCVGCAAPGIGGVVAAVAGGSAGAGVARVATSLAYDLSTVVFLVTLLVLYVRPFDGTLVLTPPDVEES